MGRHRKYPPEKIDEFDAIVDEYFESGCTKKMVLVKIGKDEYEERFIDVPTITGLCLYLGFNSRDALYEYQKLPTFADSVKRARIRIECHYEEGIQGERPVGSIFALKNFGWSDRPAEEKYVGQPNADLVTGTIEEISDEIDNRIG